MLAQARRLAVLDMIRKQGVAEVQRLAERFNCSAATIRNDLNELERRGLVRRAHGGAVSLDYGREEDTPMGVRQTLMAKEKAEIAQLAAELVADGDSIMVDGSSTILQLVRRIKDRRHLTVVTNAIEVAAELAGISSMMVIVVGGVLRHPSLSLVGGEAEDALRRFRVGKTFLSTRGITLDRGLTDTSVEEARIHAAMLAAGEHSYLLADSTKFGVDVFVSTAPLDRLTAVITDRRPREPFMQELGRLGIPVVYNRTQLHRLIRSGDRGRSQVIEGGDGGVGVNSRPPDGSAAGDDRPV